MVELDDVLHDVPGDGEPEARPEDLVEHAHQVQLLHAPFLVGPGHDAIDLPRHPVDEVADLRGLDVQGRLDPAPDPAVGFQQGFLGPVEVDQGVAEVEEDRGTGPGTMRVG